MAVDSSHRSSAATTNIRPLRRWTHWGDIQRLQTAGTAGLHAQIFSGRRPSTQRTNTNTPYCAEQLNNRVSKCSPYVWLLPIIRCSHNSSAATKYNGMPSVGPPWVASLGATSRISAGGFCRALEHKRPAGDFWSLRVLSLALQKNSVFPGSVYLAGRFGYSGFSGSEQLRENVVAVWPPGGGGVADVCPKPE